MFGHQLLDVSYLGASEVTASGQAQRVKPKLCDLILAFDVHVMRLASVTRIEEKPIWTFFQNGRHSFDFRSIVLLLSATLSHAPARSPRRRLQQHTASV